MPANFDVPTRVSMFARLKNNEDQAWSRFVQRYGPMINMWCTRRSLTPSESADITQDVLVKLVTIMRDSRYDPAKGSFRCWLKAVTCNAMRDVMRTWSRPGYSSGDPVGLAQLDTMEDPHALAEIEEYIDAEYREMALREAERRVKQRVRGFTWRAYEITAVEQRAAREAAEELNMKIAEVYVAKSRVIKMLREEILCVESSLDRDP